MDVSLELARYYEQNRLPSDGLVFYAPLDAWHQTAETGQQLTYGSNTGQFTTVQGVPCGIFYPGGGRSTAISIADLTGMQKTDSGFTISYWVNLAGIGEREESSLFIGYYDWDSSFALSIESQVLKFSLARFSNTVSSDVSCTTGTWYHQLGTIDPNRQRMYVNGVQAIDRVSDTWNSFDTKTGIVIGTFYTWGSYPMRYIAAARVYNRVLSQDEITALANEFHPN